MPCCDANVDTTKERKYDMDKATKDFVFFGPSCSGKAFPLFQDGRAFRVVSGKKWSIYNDTSNCEIHVNFVFANDVPVFRRKYSDTTVQTVSGKKMFSLIVYPYATVSFVKFSKKGEYGYSSSNHCTELTSAYISQLNRATFDNMTREINAVARIAASCHTDEEVLYKCRKCKKNYVDINFKPERLSLQRPTDKKSLNRPETITWKRVEDGLPDKLASKVQVFREGVRPRAVKQGQIGDCWLMCSIAVVAEQKKLVEDLFKHPVSNSKRKKERAAGGFRVYFNKCGWWHNVIVDGYLPTKNRELCFGRSGTDPLELWVALIEKAYAKLHGSYANIIGGQALNALKDLTGFPTYAFDAMWREAAVDDTKASQFFKKLRAQVKRGFVISISTPGEDNSDYNKANGNNKNTADFEKEYSALGLGTGHAYSVLDVKQFVMPNIKLLKIRNPWGSVEWKGAWGAHSPLWKKHPLVRRYCKPGKLHGGTFWMEWKDVVRYFDGGCVCMVKRKWHDYRFRGCFNGIYPDFALKIEPKSKHKIFLTISQNDRRVLPADDPDQQYKGLLIAVARPKPESGNVVVTDISTANPEVHPADTFNFEVLRDVSMELEVDPKLGPYYVIPRIMVVPKSGTKDFALSLLTPKEVTAKGLRVSFVTLKDDCDIYKNRKEFDVGKESPVKLQFQSKKRGGAPRLHEGTDVGTATPVKEEFPFPY